MTSEPTEDSNDEFEFSESEEVWIQQLKSSFEDLEAGRLISSEEVSRMLREGLSSDTHP